jgi:hypothetical protein
VGQNLQASTDAEIAEAQRILAKYKLQVTDIASPLFKVDCAISASTHPGPLYDFYVALLGKGMRPTMARLTLARKIASTTLTIWTKGVDFDATPLHRQEA